MKYEVKISGVGKELVDSDSFETQNGLVIFYNIGDVPEGGKFPIQYSVAAFPLDLIQGIKEQKRD